MRPFAIPALALAVSPPSAFARHPPSIVRTAPCRRLGEDAGGRRQRRRGPRHEERRPGEHGCVGRCSRFSAGQRSSWYQDRLRARLSLLRLSKSDTVRMEMVLLHARGAATVKVTADEIGNAKPITSAPTTSTPTARFSTAPISSNCARHDELTRRLKTRDPGRCTGWIENVWSEWQTRRREVVDSVVLKRKPSLGITPPMIRPNTMGRRVHCRRMHRPKRTSTR